VIVENIGQSDAASSQVASWIAATPLGDPIDPDMVATQSVAAVPANDISNRVDMQVTLPAGLAPGSYYLVYEANSDGVLDERDISNNRYALEIDIESAPLETLEIDLPAGEVCRMLSLPLIAPDTPIEDVLGPIATLYETARVFDPTTQDWKRYVSPASGIPAFGNTLQTVGPTDGLWLCGTQAGTLTISGTYPDTATINLVAGWNLIGFPVATTRDLETLLAPIDGHYTLVRTYDHTTGAWKKYSATGPAFGNDLHQIEPGAAYWIEVNQDTTLTMTNP
jgi:hypothetical protein